MAETLLIPSSGDLLRTAPVTTVYTKDRWQGDWVERSYLYADLVRWGSGPARSEATLEWRYGIGMPAGTSAMTTYTPYDLLGHYVRIDIQQEVVDPADPDEGPTEEELAAAMLRWYGVITENADRREGATLVSDVRVRSGRQVLVAEGIDLLLERAFCVSSWVRVPGGGEKEIKRGLTFNDPNTYDDTGNRSNSTLPVNGSAETHIFASDLDDARWWSTRDILEYILALLAPKNARFTFTHYRLSTNAKAILPTWDRPVLPSQGRDLRSMVNELCDRRRNLNWRLVVEHENPNPYIELDVWPFNADAVTLPSGEVAPANKNPKTLDLDRAVDVQVMLRETDHERVDQVVVRGARKRAVVSLSAEDGTLEADWRTEDQDEYEALPTEISGLADLDRKQARMAKYRTEDKLVRVFSYFRLPPAWNGKVGDGKGGAQSWFATEEGALETFYWPEMRFERTLPKELAAALVNTTHFSPKTDLPPLCLIRLLDADVDDGTGTQRWVHIERAAADGGSERVGDGGRRWFGSLRMQHDVPGVIVKLRGGRTGEGEGQHLIAGSDFTPISAINDTATDLDWETIILTVMFELDTFAEERYPELAGMSLEMESPRIVYVDLGGRARMDWVHPGAVRKVVDGVPYYQSGDSPSALGEWIRNDSESMQDLAKFVFEWYGTTRKAFTLVLKQISGILEVGDLVTQIGAAETLETVNACVTGISMDLMAGTTRIDTGFAELDPIQYL